MNSFAKSCLNNNKCITEVKAGIPASKAEHSALVSYSKKDAPWDKNRSYSEDVADIYTGTGEHRFDRLAERIGDCSQFLTFNWQDNRETGETALKLAKTQFCRVRHCPVCQWRRSLMWQARFWQALPELTEKHPTARFLFLTLTVKNVDVTGLRETLQHMNKSWQRLIKRKEFSVVKGWVRTTEITRAKDGKAHPHFHALVMVNSNYFTKNYIKQSRWSELWGSCLKVDYMPVTDIRVIRGRDGKTVLNSDPKQLQKAIAETLKYSVKPDDMINDPAWFLELTKQVHKLRFIASGGALKDVLKQDEESNEDLIDTGLGEDDGEEVTQDQIVFNWRPSMRQYHKFK